ncbi:MAG: hypothetical protein AB7L84_14855, partial [Acidimicrobiia bacterium]
MDTNPGTHPSNHVRADRRARARLRHALAAVLAVLLVAGGLVVAPVVAFAAETTYTHFAGETVTYDTEAVVGEPIRVSGTGWLAKPDFVDEGEEGSVIGLKLIDPTLGQLERQELLENPRLGTTITNATVWGVVWADSDGNFEVELEWPDASVAKPGFVPSWEPGDTFTLQLLSGTLYSDEPGVDPTQRPDVSRTVPLTITVVDAGPVATAPVVTQQPVTTENAISGSEVTFTAAASGDPAPTVQWQRSTAVHASVPPANWVDISGATDPTLTIVAGTSPHTNNRWYRAVFTNAEGSATTEAARLAIAAAPTVTQQPAGATISDGGTATFTAAASSPVATTVRWQSTATALPNGEPDDATWTDVPGATAATLVVEGAGADRHGTFYRAVFTGSGSTNTQPAQLRFFEHLDTNGSVTVSGESYTAGQSPLPFSVSAPNAVVAGQPIVISGTGYVHTDGTQGSVVNFFVDAAYSGDPNTLNTTREITHPVTGQVMADKRTHAVLQASPDGTWQVQIPWPDHTNTTQTEEFFATNWAPGTHHIVRILTGSLLNGDHQRGISVRFTVLGEPTQTEVAPEVTGQPADLTVQAGEDAVFTAAATGDPAPTVQWESSDDGETWSPIAGATATTLTLAGVTVEQSGIQYRAVFTNAAGSATSEVATLTVDPVPPTPAVVVHDGTVELGGTVRVTGEGFVHPEGGGSRIALKIDDGAIARVDSTLHPNQTIWWIVDAEA